MLDALDPLGGIGAIDVAGALEPPGAIGTFKVAGALDPPGAIGVLCELCWLDPPDTFEVPDEFAGIGSGSFSCTAAGSEWSDCAPLARAVVP